jgi:hypothetical protein
MTRREVKVRIEKAAMHIISISRGSMSMTRALEAYVIPYGSPRGLG